MNNLHDVIITVRKVMSHKRRNHFCNDQEWNDHQKFLKALTDERFEDCKHLVMKTINQIILGYGDAVNGADGTKWLKAKMIVDLHV